jgi:hypothetical protein
MLVLINIVSVYNKVQCIIYDFLGASPDQIPLLNLAGPVTGLLIQPLIGALSDKTWHPKWGRHTLFSYRRFTVVVLYIIISI